MTGIRQRGAALLLFCVALIAASGVSLRHALHDHRQQVRVQSPGIRLQAARDELLALAVSYADHYGPSGAGPGHLPCPNTRVPDGRRENESPSPPCGGLPVVLGRLPRQAGSSAGSRVTVYQRGSYDHQDALWYAVSGAFVNNPMGAAQIVNPGTRGALQLGLQEDIVAVVIYPGPAIGQQRAARPSARPEAYLELENADADVSFTSFGGVGGNDRVLPITREQLMRVVRPRITAYLIDWLRQWSLASCGKPDYCFPFAANDDGGLCETGLLSGRLPLQGAACTGPGLLDPELGLHLPLHRHWFVRNRWTEWVDYTVAAACTSGERLCHIEVEDKAVDEPLSIRVDVAAPGPV